MLGVPLIGFDDDNALGAMYLYSCIGSVDDCHEFQEKMSLEDAIIPDVEACNFKRQHLLVLVISSSIRYL
jgi:hypothetical protein